jgi:ribokinase
MAFLPGGKGGNQAVAARRAGAGTLMIGCVGADAFGRRLARFLADEGVDVSRVDSIEQSSTGTAIVTVSEAGDNTVVISPGANAHLSPVPLGARDLGPGDVAVSQFESPLGTVSAFMAAARVLGATTVLNPAPAAALPAGLMTSVDVLVVNETELSVLSGAHITPTSADGEIVGALQAVPGHRGIATIATLGARGAIARLADGDFVIAGHRVTAVDTAGAGDCFVGVLAARLAAGDDARTCVRYANAAAAVCVGRPGTAPAMPTLGEIERALRHGGAAS